MFRSLPRSRCMRLRAAARWRLCLNSLCWSSAGGAAAQIRIAGTERFSTAHITALIVEHHVLAVCRGAALVHEVDADSLIAGDGVAHYESAGKADYSLPEIAVGGVACDGARFSAADAEALIAAGHVARDHRRIADEDSDDVVIGDVTGDSTIAWDRVISRADATG